MKNLKKLMSVILTVAMLLSLVATSVGAATFADVEEDNAAYEAIEVLAALKILEGKEEGNFDPEANIKRSEFAAVICRAMNQEAAAAGSASVAKFTDVAAGHWAAGYINWAAGQGIVNGTDAELGTFEPDANVTYEQAVAMIVRAMGFEPLALKRGGFPTGYMVVAAGYKVTDGVAMVPANGAATRAGVAQLVYNALDAATMEEGLGANIYGGTLYNIYDGKENEKVTLLSKYHNIYAVEAYVVDTFNSNPGLLDPKKDLKSVELDVITKGNDKDGYKANGFTDEQFDAAFDIDITKNLEPIVTNDAYGNYLGYYVKAFLTVDEDDNLVLVAMVPDKDVDTITITNVKANVVEAAIAGEKATLEFYEDEELIDDLEFVDFSNLTIYKNGLEVEDKEGTFKGIKGNAGIAKLVLLGNNEEYSKIFITEYDYAIVESVNADRAQLKMEGDISYLDLAKDNKDVLSYSIFKDGEAITLADIAEGDLLNIAVADTDKGNIYEIHVTNDVVEGSVSYFDPEDDVYTIGDADYTAVYQKKHADANWKPGSTGAFYITIDGRIFDAEITSGFTGNYAFIINGGKVTSGGVGDGYYELQLLTKDNVVDVYKVASNLKVWEGTKDNYNAVTYTYSGTTGKKQDDLFAKGAGSVAKLWEANVTKDAKTEAKIDGLFVTVKIEGDTITTISFPCDGEDFNKVTLDGTKKYEKDRNMLGKNYTTDATVLFDIAVENGVVSEDSVQVYTISRLNDEDPLKGYAYAIDDNTKEIGALAISDGLTDTIDANALALVTGVSQGTNNAGEPVDVLNTFVQGEFVGYPVAEKYATEFDGKKLAKGDVIQLNVNAAGEVEKVVVVYTYATRTLENLNIKDVDYLFYAGVVTDDKRGIEIDSKDVKDKFLTWDLSEASTNVLVDVAKWGRNGDIVSKADNYHIMANIENLDGKDKFTSDAYVVVVRTNDDDEILDVVAYEYDYKDEDGKNIVVEELVNSIIVK